MRALNKFYFEIYDQDALLAINDFMKKFNVKNQALKHKNIQKKQSILDYAGIFNGELSGVDAKKIRKDAADKI
ncbi:hypothetical protein [Campylobacter rectus]|uniref:Uncharacterized protein n=1 Tax=Campylobacter rectus TaxID=203 RepID=A0A6G5QJZ8_CAMRE|nr:hypothetical protein [Campylobacter rectus]QCD45932.1 hypothetical protein CRECT_0232 [Campylobacter rectus]RRD55504.1 hypothetical protein EII16_00465 [Campylobacter rectus]UEB46645.1 hypothetical protein LK437_06340 [Campylobacter rectus]